MWKIKEEELPKEEEQKKNKDPTRPQMMSWDVVFMNSKAASTQAPSSRKSSDPSHYKRKAEYISQSAWGVGEN